MSNLSNTANIFNKNKIKIMCNNPDHIPFRSTLLGARWEEMQNDR